MRAKRSRGPSAPPTPRSSASARATPAGTPRGGAPRRYGAPPAVPRARAQPGLPAHRLRELRGTFEAYDTNCSGAISKQELGACLRASGAAVPQSAVDAAFARADRDGSGRISWAEYVELHLEQQRAQQRGAEHAPGLARDDAARAIQRRARARGGSAGARRHGLGTVGVADARSRHLSPPRTSAAPSVHSSLRPPPASPGAASRVAAHQQRAGTRHGRSRRARPPRRMRATTD